MPFGVELPENVGTSSPSETPTPTEHTQTASTESTEEQVSTKAEQPETIQELLDLDKLERFRFAGKEWSPKELQNSYLMHSDYTRKTQEVAEARKYADNFSIDMQKVLQQPDLMDNFASVYPKSYVEAAKRILEQVGNRHQDTPNAQQTNRADNELKREIQDIRGTLTEWQKSQQAAEVEKIQGWLDSQFETLSKKYPFANEDAVTARAGVLSDQGTKITKEVLDKIFKANNDEIKGRWDKMYKAKVDEQLKAGAKSKDVASGGGIPGAAPKGFKTIKEATAQFIDDIRA